jgi:hypothetical protein
MNAEELTAKLSSLRACHAAQAWTKGKSLEEAWKTCEHADWMLWYAARVCDRKTVVLAACACARTVLKYVPGGEDRPRIALETAEAWTRGEATIDQVKAAHAAAAAAYAAAAAAHADAAAHAAAHADAAAHAAAHADDARAKSLRNMANIVRTIIPEVD